MKQIHWERWSRFYLPRGHPYLWSRARRVTQPQPRVYNMIREELALVKQNGAWKPRRKKGWSGLFYPPNGLNFQFCWFNLIFLIAPSWSESNFIFFLFFYSIRVGPSRSELIRPRLAVRVDPVRLLYCHYVAKNIPTEEDMNEEYLAPYPVWFLCWIWWVLACFESPTVHPPVFKGKSIFRGNSKDD